mgnify:CR=1 FL=1
MDKFLGGLRTNFGVDTTPITEDEDVMTYVESIALETVADGDLDEDERVETFAKALEGFIGDSDLELGMGDRPEMRELVNDFLRAIAPKQGQEPEKDKQSQSQGQHQQDRQEPPSSSPRTTVYEIFSGQFQLKFIDFALTKISSVEELVDVLMDRAGVRYTKIRTEWEKLKEREAEKENEEQGEKYHVVTVNKQNILKRFDDVAISTGSTTRQKPKPSKPKKEKTDDNSKIRYIDGQVVSRTGQKTIVFDDTLEWDGGSRGKVKSKGKRGKGYY